MEGKITNYSFTILALYRTDYTTSLHVRAMAKLLATSHVTLLPHLKWLERNKIFISRKVGKNKDYLLNPNNISTKYYLILAEELATIEYLERNFLIKRLAAHITSVDVTGPLILFGSYAKGYSNEASDIDLFYIGNLPQKQREKTKRFEKTFGREINIKTSTIENFNIGLRTSDTLIKEVVKDHIILQNPDLFVGLLWRYYTEG